MVDRVRPAVVRITSSAGTGSGVIYDTQGQTGYAVTNYHVVEGQSTVNVTVNDSARYTGNVLGVDVVRDLAVVSICCGNFKALEFGNAARLAVGDEVVNVGYALAIEGAATVTRGIVSALRYDSDHQAYVIQSDAPINPGNSGGPMLSPEGRVLGINSFVYVSDYGAEGIGFAISARTVQQRVPTLRGGTAIPISPPTSELRSRDQWTVANPATREEIEAELQKYRGRRLVFATWGGAYEAAQNRAYMIPFEEQFGIELVTETMNYANVRAQVGTGNLQWHVLDYGGQAAWQAANDGYLEPLDFSVIDNREFLEVGKSPYFGGGGITWSNVLAYSLESVHGKWSGRYPQTMADVFDWGNFPGERSLAAPEWSWKTSLRFALLSRYPGLLDSSAGRDSLTILSNSQVDEAYEILDEIGPRIKFWWSAGVDCPSGLISREIDFCTAWNGRIFDASVIQGESIAICWSCGHVVNTDSWGAPRGLKDQDPYTFELAQLFMAWTSLPEINAELSKYISYGPMNLGAVPILDGPEFNAIREHIPNSTANIPYAIFADENRDGQVGYVMGERWVTWQQTLQ